MSESLSKIDRVQRFFENGGNLTAGQARTRFGIRNMDSVVRELRSRGLAVYENETSTAYGNPITLFRLGTPTKRVVAAGYKALGLA